MENSQQNHKAPLSLTKDGKFTARKQQVTLIPTSKPNYCWIWTLISHPHEIIFTWQAVRQSLPINLKLFKRKCSQTPMCPLCKTSQETHIHILRDCPHTKQIWQLLQPPQHFFDKNLKSWLKDNI